MLEIEARGPYNQFYKFHLLNISEESAEISETNDSKSSICVPLSILYKISEGDCPKVVKIGDEIEVYIQITEIIPTIPLKKQLSNTDEDLYSKLSVIKCQLAWWPAQVQNIREEYLVVKIIGISSCIDVVEKAFVRSIVPCSDDSRSTNGRLFRRALNKESIFRRVIRIPKELNQCSRDIAVHQVLLRYCKSPATLYYDDSKCYLNVFSFDNKVIRQVELLEDTYLKMLKQKWNLMQSMNHATRRLEYTRLAKNKSANFVESFSIPQVCMGLAIGSKGVNIQCARNINGVVSIDVCDEMCSFVIYAKTKDAIRAARKILEYSEVIVEVPKHIVSRIIGKSGSNIQSLVDKSGVVRVRIENDRRFEENNPYKSTMKTADSKYLFTNHRDHAVRKILNVESEIAKAESINGDGVISLAFGDNKDFINFFFIGTIESIENAKLLVNFQVETYRELDIIQDEKAEIVKELHSIEYPYALNRTNSTIHGSVLVGSLHDRNNFHPLTAKFHDNHMNSEARPSKYPSKVSYSANNMRLEKNKVVIPVEDYSLAPGGPPSGSMGNERHNLRESSNSVDVHKSKCRLGRQNYPTTLRSECRKLVNNSSTSNCTKDVRRVVHSEN